MGMSASQLRYMLLTERKTDVEFHGQQINQQRTTLATQSSAYNMQLLNIKVPTPPSSGDYTKTTYTFFDSSNATCKVLGTIYDSQFGTYTINYSSSVQTDQGRSSGAANLVFSNGEYKLFNANANALTATVSPLDITSNTPEAQQNLANIELLAGDLQLEDDNGFPYGDPNWEMPNFYSYNVNGATRYVLQRDLANAGTSINDLGTAIPTYYIQKDATINKSSQLNDATINWSTSGRMSSIVDSEGNEYTLSVTTENDDTAYQSALNEYEFQQAKYNETINRINAFIENVQSQDKKLEIKLKDLDTQQEAIQTEIDSVKKVIDKNVEGSFKTFG